MTGLFAVFVILVTLVIQLVLTMIQMATKTLKALIVTVINTPILLISSIVGVFAIASLLFFVAIVSVPIMLLFSPLLLVALFFSPLLIIVGTPIVLAILGLGVVSFSATSVVVAVASLILAAAFGVLGLPCAWPRLLSSSLQAIYVKENSGDPVGKFIQNFIFTMWKYLVPSLPGFGNEFTGISALLFREPCMYHEPKESQLQSNKYDGEVWIYINGIATTKEIADSNRDLLYKMFGRPVHLVHNPTDSLLVDLIECLAWKVGLLKTFTSIGAFL